MNVQRTERSVVTGAGMAGLMAAVVLSERFDEVVIVEKDELPSTPQIRKGVPQGAHVPTFLGYAVEAIEDLLPGIMADLYEAGAVRIRRNHDIWFQDAAGPTPIRDVGILTPSVTRPLLEHVTRLHVRAVPNVSIRDRSRFIGFLSNDGQNTSGVRLQTSDGETEISADLVVDCSSRASDLPRWLP